MPRDSKSYKLPAVIDPEAYQAICVLVPSDTLYLGAFWNAYEYFTKYVAWERDAAHSGTLAAQVWKVGFDQARANWLAGVECNMAPILRQNPANDCQLQQSHDGGDTWSLAFDFSLCGGPLVSTPPYPGSGTGDSDAAGEAIRNMFIGLLELNADCMLIREEFISAGTNYLRLFDPSYSNPVALGELYDAYCSADPSVQDDAREDCYYSDVHIQFADCWDDEGLIADLNCLSEKLIDALDDASDALMAALIKAVNSLTGNAWQTASAGAAGGGGGGFGSECGWCHEFDYSIDPYDSFIHGSLVIESGEYVAGVGYQNNGTDSGALIRHQYDGLYTITHMEMDFTSDGGIHHGSEFARLNTQHGTFAGNTFNPTDPFQYQHMVHTGGGTISFGRDGLATGYTQAWIQGFSDEFAATWPVLTITRFRVCGTGPDPYDLP